MKTILRYAILLFIMPLMCVGARCVRYNLPNRPEMKISKSCSRSGTLLVPAANLKSPNGICKHDISGDTLQLLINELKRIPVANDYTLIGELQIDSLVYQSMVFGDMLHLLFVDKNNKEYDFGSNLTDVVLFSESEEITENNGFVGTEEFLHKPFLIVWRLLRLNHEPRNEMEMYYQEYNEILYLKQLD